MRPIKIALLTLACSLQVAGDASVSKAAAPAFDLYKVQEIDRTSSLDGLSISPDEEHFAYITRQKEDYVLMIRAVETGKLIDTVVISGGSRTAWSPDGEKIAVCSGGTGQISIVDLTLKKTVKLPTRVRSCGEGIVWPTQDSLIYKPYSENPGVLSLVDLKTAPVAVDYYRQLTSPKQRSTHDLAYLWHCGGICVSSADGAYTRTLMYLGRDDGSEFVSTRDQTRFVAIAFHPLEQSSSRLFIGQIAVREPPPIRFVAAVSAAGTFSTMPKMRDWLERGVPVTGHVWEPRINPLNGMTVGSEGSQHKALVRVEATSEKGVLVRVVNDAGPGASVGVGDVVKGFVTPRDAEGRFYSSGGSDWLVLLETAESGWSASPTAEAGRPEAERSINVGAGTPAEDIEGDSGRTVMPVPRKVASASVQFLVSIDPDAVINISRKAMVDAGYTLVGSKSTSHELRAFRHYASADLTWVIRLGSEDSEGHRTLIMERGTTRRFAPKDVEDLLRYVVESVPGITADDVRFN